MSKVLGQIEGSEDELDALLDAYTNEAVMQNRRLEEKEASRSKPRSMAGIRAAGLAQPLGAGNKGYMLLKKLGYQDGSGLGGVAVGRVEPLTLDLKAGRAGLGLDEQRRRQREAHQQKEEAERLKRARLAAHAQQAFQAAARSGYGARMLVKHLRGAWRVAEQLDEQLVAASTSSGGGDGSRQQVRDEELSPALGSCTLPGDSGDRDGEGCRGIHDGADTGPGLEKDTSSPMRGSTGLTALGPVQVRTAALQRVLAQLPTLAVMLREEEEEQEVERQRASSGAGEHRGRDELAAGRVGAKSDGDGECSGGRAGPECRDIEDVSEGEAVAAAGPRRAMKGGGGGGGGGGREEAGNVPGGKCSGVASTCEAPDVPPPPLEDQLATLLHHLRDRHCYCYFCGCQYDSADDLAASCPGLTEDLH